MGEMQMPELSENGIPIGPNGEEITLQDVKDQFFENEDVTVGDLESMSEDALKEMIMNAIQ